MAEASITVETRNEGTKGQLKMLREQGKIPGVVYGKQQENELIVVDEKELLQLLKMNAGGVLQLEAPNNGTRPVMVGEVQRDKVLKNRILHVDFHQIDMRGKVKATVRVELMGEAAGVREGGLLQQLQNTVDIRCVASDIPAAITVDVSGLQQGEHLYARDLQLPPGVELKSDENEIVVTILTPQKELAEETREENEQAIAADAAKEAEIAT